MLLCALMCLSSVNIILICIIMFYQINSLTHIETIIFISRESITQHMLKLRLHHFVSFTYIVIYPENEKYLKKYLKYFSKVFVFKYISMYLNTFQCI